MSFNLDIFEGKIKHMRGQFKSWWGRLTNDDLKQIEGNYQSLIGILQERYGWSKRRAEKEFHQHMTQYKEEQEADRAIPFNEWEENVRKDKFVAESEAYDEEEEYESVPRKRYGNRSPW